MAYGLLGNFFPWCKWGWCHALHQWGAAGTDSCCIGAAILCHRLCIWIPPNGEQSLAVLPCLGFKENSYWSGKGRWGTGVVPRISPDGSWDRPQAPGPRPLGNPANEHICMRKLNHVTCLKVWANEAIILVKLKQHRLIKHPKLRHKKRFSSYIKPRICSLEKPAGRKRHSGLLYGCRRRTGLVSMQRMISVCQPSVQEQRNFVRDRLTRLFRWDH